MTEFPCPVQAAAQRHPDAPAIVAPHRTYSFAQYHQFATSAAANLRKSGLGEGDIIAIGLPPGTPYPILFAALARAGAVAFPVNTTFPAQYLLDILKRVRCRTMVVPYGASIVTVHGRLFAMAPRDIVDEHPAPDPGPIHIPGDRPCTIVLTSGSSGTPKAALHSYENHHHSARRMIEALGMGPGDRWLLSLPLYHVAGIGVIYRCAISGAAVVVPAADESIKVALVKYGVTHVSLVSTQLYRLMQDDDAIEALRELKVIMLGGGPVAPALIRQAVEAELPVYTSYGLTEMASTVTLTQPDEPLDGLLTSGRVLEPGTIRISAGGEILVRGATLFMGYVNGNEVERRLDHEAWFHTGDLGNIDPRGYLRVTGRKDNMFIAGGENIQPEEVEACLLGIDYVEQAAVVPVAHEEFDNTPVAFLRLEEGVPIDEDVITRYLADHLPKHALPRHYFRWPDDASAGLKVDRTALIAHAQQLVNARRS